MQLYPDQIDVVERTRAAYQRGRRAPLIVAPTGFGKAILASFIMAGTVAKGGRPLFIADRCTLIDQLVAKLAMAGITAPRVIQADRDDGPRDAPVTVASAPTLRLGHWADRLPEASFLIWDECFPAGTLVDGRPIEALRVGDLVRSYDHNAGCVELRPVRRLFVSRPAALVTVYLDDGRAITCTAGHPFFTGAGYVPALRLQTGDWLYGNQSKGLRGVRNPLHTEVLEYDNDTNLLREVQTGTPRCPSQVPAYNMQGVRSGDGTDREDAHGGRASRSALLFDEMPRRLGITSQLRDHGENQSHPCEPTHEGAQSDARCQNPEAGECDAQANRSPPEDTWWQWARSVRIGDQASSGTTEGMGDASRRSHSRDESVRLPWTLQDRHREPVDPYRDRDRRPDPFHVGTQEAGCQEAGMARVARVARVEVHERRSSDGFGALCPDDLVYNIEVDGNHNYFVDGILVHNCHHTAANTYRALIQRFPSALRLGLTATPARGDNRPLDMFDELVVGPSVAQLIALGRLAPCQVIAPKPLRPGELARSPIDAWRQFAGGRRAAIFRTRVSEAVADRDAFRAAGLRAEAVTATTRDRAEILARFATGELDAVASVGVLTEGWDDPGCAVAIVACQPGHVARWLQICGRVLRYQPDKQALVIDLGGAVHEHGHPAEERTYSLDGKGIAPLPRDSIRQCGQCGSVALGRPTTCPYCGWMWPVATKRGARIVSAEMDEVTVGAPRREYVVSMTAKRGGLCARCGRGIRSGEQIFWATVAKRARHQRCPAIAAETGATP